MGVGADLYVVCCRRTKVHVRYLISWWVLVPGCRETFGLPDKNSLGGWIRRLGVYT